MKALVMFIFPVVSLASLASFLSASNFSMLAISAESPVAVMLSLYASSALTSFLYLSFFRKVKESCTVGL